MPEYLAPGVFVEEVPGGVKPIAGVSTSTIGMVGMTERGPVNIPSLVTSFGTFTRVFGRMLNPDVFTNNRDALPYAVQGAFDNGAGRIYVSRIVGENATFGVADLFGNAVTLAAATTLAERAVADAAVLRINDGTNLSLGDQLLLSDGPRSEYVTASSDPVAIGVALAGRLHVPQGDTLAVDQQNAAVEVNDLTAEVTGDMDAGAGLQLSAVAIAALNAGDLLRVQQTDDPDVTEFVTITANGDAAFNETTLLFDHPQASVEMHVVTLADSGTSTTVDGDTGAGSTIVPLSDVAGLAEGDIVAIGAGATREFHVLQAIVSELSIATSHTQAIHAQGTAVFRQIPLIRIHARDQGQWANNLQVRVRPSPLCETTVAVAAAVNDSPVTLTTVVGLHPGSIVSIRRNDVEIARQRVDAIDRAQNQVELTGGAAVALQDGDDVVSQEVTLIIELLGPDGKVSMDEAFDDLAMDPAHPRYAPNILGVFDRTRGEPADAGLSDLVRLSDLTRDDNGVDLIGAAEMRLATPFDAITRSLAGGDDDLGNVGELTYRGQDAEDVDDRTGIHALTGIDDISIIAVPGQSGQIVQNAMITHCERMRYRIAVLDSAVNAKLADIQAQRALYDNTRAALYYPWLQIVNQFGQPGERLIIPPSGHVCGAFARTDTERGVHKAPANVVVRNILDLNAKITTGEQEILNPRGINVIRDFSSLGRSKRIWGARTISSDSEWRYVPVRRLFLFIEKSIERGTQFAVFEPNSQPLWATINRSLTNFLTSVWRDGALMGTSPEEAFFVEVGLNTMTQADIDAGRLIVQIGIAPVKPAEFVIFRISQKTAGASA